MKSLTKVEEILLLSIWKLDDDAYGVKIRKHVSECIGRDFTYGNLYSALHQLTAKKFVTKAMGDPTPERRGRPKILYRVSPTGLEALKEACEMNDKLWSGISPLAFDRKT
jgi:DNA-binding PadR family transcriptional regulator